jgi:hypothetical protein
MPVRRFLSAQNNPIAGFDAGFAIQRCANGCWR